MLTYVVGVGSPLLLSKTLLSLPEAARCVAAVLPEHIDEVRRLKEGPPRPFSVVGFGEGAVRKADAWNECVKDQWGDSVAFCFLEPGDSVSQAHAERVLQALTDPVVGVVFCDRVENGFRVFEEPYARNRIAGQLWQPPGVVLSKPALQEAGLFDPDATPGELYDLLLRVTKRRMAVHLPEALLRAIPRPPIPVADGVAAWRRAVSLASTK